MLSPIQLSGTGAIVPMGLVLNHVVGHISWYGNTCSLTGDCTSDLESGWDWALFLQWGVSKTVSLVQYLGSQWQTTFLLEWLTVVDLWFPEAH